MSNSTQVLTTIGGAIIGFFISGMNPMGAVRGKAIAADSSIFVREIHGQDCMRLGLAPNGGGRRPQ